MQGAFAGVLVPSSEPQAALGEPRASLGDAKVLHGLTSPASLILQGPGFSAGSHKQNCWVWGYVGWEVTGTLSPWDFIRSQLVLCGHPREWPGSAGWELSEVWSNFYLYYTKETFLLVRSGMLTPLR